MIVRKDPDKFTSSNDKKLAEQDPKDMKIKIPKTTHDDKVIRVCLNH